MTGHWASVCFLTQNGGAGLWRSERAYHFTGMVFCLPGKTSWRLIYQSLNWNEICFSNLSSHLYDISRFPELWSYSRGYGSTGLSFDMSTLRFSNWKCLLGPGSQRVPLRRWRRFVFHVMWAFFRGCCSRGRTFTLFRVRVIARVLNNHNHKCHFGGDSTHVVGRLLDTLFLLVVIWGTAKRPELFGWTLNLFKIRGFLFGEYGFANDGDGHPEGKEFPIGFVEWSGQPCFLGHNFHPWGHFNQSSPQYWEYCEC